MPARLLLLDEASTSPTEHWIERPFVAIGTDPGSDLPLGGGAEVRIYLQFREGRYEVFNKQAGEVRLAGRSVPAGTSAAWEPGAELEAGRHRLRLVVEGDPAPGPRPLAAAPRPAREQARELVRAAQATPSPVAALDAAPPADRSRTVKLGVIFACLAASTLLLVRDRILPSSAAVASDPEAVTGLIKDAFPAKTTELQPAAGDSAAATNATELRQRLARRLQWAETAWLQGDYPLATERYTALKQYLDASRVATDDGASPAADEWQARLAGHVDGRLADLARQ